MGTIAWYHRTRPDAPYKPAWTDSEIERLRTLATTSTAAACAEAIGRSRQSVEAKAHRLGVQFTSPDTNTAHGRIGETIALTLLPGARHLSAEKYHSPFDLDWNGQAIDVKVGHRRLTGETPYYAFDLGPNKSADAFLCLALDGPRLERAWLVPAWAVANVTGLSIGAGTSKYEAFELRRPA